jgi:hypothetical protein
MIATGYTPATGDTWAINEVGTPSDSAFATDVFNDVDGARQNFRDFVHGLYDGSGNPGDPTMQGLVFAANPEQLAPNVADYAEKLAAWYGDAPFWQDMHTYVSTWAQETYADARAWGVAGSPLAVRTAYLNDYFLHGLRVAEQGNDATTAARKFLDAAYVPLANATYPSDGPKNPITDSGFGYTNIGLPGMLRFISAQTYAQRSSFGTRLGFAISPPLSAQAADTRAVENRVASAIHDSQTDPIGACTATGESCDFDVAGAAFTVSWDFKPPEVTCAPTPSKWQATNVSIACTASDGGSGLADPADASFNLSTSVPSGSETANASTNDRSVCDKAGHCVTAGPIDGIKVDEKEPSLDCGAAPTTWQATNVSIACTASDGGSGLADPANGSFSLTTSVELGTETANASTNSHSVCDNADNCVTAGPIDRIMVDEKGPALDCGAAPTFVLNQTGATITAAAADGGSGVPSPSVSAAADTSIAGSHSVNPVAADNVGNSTTVSCPYSIGYALSGFERPIANTPTVNTGKAGRTYPVKWQLQDANGGYISTLNAVAQVVVQPTPCDDFATDPDSTMTVTAAGATSLRYDSGANQYVYNWATPSTTGCYTLFVELDSGQTLHAYFQLG